MNAEGAALSHNAVEQERSGLRDAVVLDKELLEFVNQEQRPGNGFSPAGPFIAGKVLDAELAEQVTAAFELIIDALQHTQTELAIALDGDHPRMGQPLGSVTLEL